MRNGLAQVGRVSQFFEPEDRAEHYDQRLVSSVRDLLRQLDFHLNPFFQGFNNASLPERVDILGFWLVRLNTKNGRKVLPVTAWAPAGSLMLWVCMPSDNGPRWLPYSRALLAAATFTGGYAEEDAIHFFNESLSRVRGKDAILLVSEQNVRSVWPDITDDYLTPKEMKLKGLPNLIDSNIRVARLRFSGHEDLPVVCPTHTFGQHAKLFANPENIFEIYSFQKRPVTAQRPNGLRQRDALRKPSWNPSTVGISMLNLQDEDDRAEWCALVHRLREESSHTEHATLLPESLHALRKIDEYLGVSIAE